MKDKESCDDIQWGARSTLYRREEWDDITMGPSFYEYQAQDLRPAVFIISKYKDQI